MLTALIPIETPAMDARQHSFPIAKNSRCGEWNSDALHLPLERYRIGSVYANEALFSIRSSSSRTGLALCYCLIDRLQNCSLRTHSNRFRSYLLSAQWAIPIAFPATIALLIAKLIKTSMSFLLVRSTGIGMTTCRSLSVNDSQAIASRFRAAWYDAMWHLIPNRQAQEAQAARTAKFIFKIS